MSDYRRFWLVNGKDETFDLTNEIGFMHDPANLGYTKTYDGLRLGDRMLVIDEYIDLLPVQGEMLFFGANNAVRYQKYFNFVQFIKNKPLVLHYHTPNLADGDSYHARVTILRLDKSEVNESDSILHCPIQFQMLHHWEHNTEVVNATSGVKDGKSYPNKHPYAYGQDGLTGILLRNDGTESVGMIITINGVCTNPKLVLSDAEGGMYAVARIIGTYNTVTINSIDTEEDMLLMTNGVAVTNPLNYQDLSLGSPSDIDITFMKLHTGASRMSFTSDGDFDGTVTIAYTPAYATV